jgi:hypothetical protein
MKMNDARQSLPPQARNIPAILWPIAFGGVGFLAGFMGPIAFNPEANQGPLLGIFITGPGGVALGVLLYLICRLFKVPAKSQVSVMVLCAVLFGVATLSLCFPSPQLRGYAVEVQIEKCQAPTQVMDAAIEYWNGRIARVTWAAPRAGWQEEARTQANSADGVVLDVRVTRESKVYMNRKPWNKGQLSGTAWTTPNRAQSYYAEYEGRSCERYPVGQKALLFTRYDMTGMSRGAGDWPPRNIADFLDRALLEQMPDEYREVLPK